MPDSRPRICSPLTWLKLRDEVVKMLRIRRITRCLHGICARCVCRQRLLSLLLSTVDSCGIPRKESERLSVCVCVPSSRELRLNGGGSVHFQRNLRFGTEVVRYLQFTPKAIVAHPRCMHGAVWKPARTLFHQTRFRLVHARISRWRDNPASFVCI